MKRVLHAAPILFLLGIWVWYAAICIWAAFAAIPVMLVYLFPIALIQVGAYRVHRRFTAMNLPLAATVATSAVLGAPLLFGVWIVAHFGTTV